MEEDYVDLKTVQVWNLPNAGVVRLTGFDLDKREVYESVDISDEDLDGVIEFLTKIKEARNK